MILSQISISIIWSALFHSRHLTLSSQCPIFESPYSKGLKIFCLILKTYFQDSVKSQKPFSSNYSLADQHSVIIFFRAWDANLDSSGWEILSNLWTVKRINHRYLAHQWSAEEMCLMKQRQAWGFTFPSQWATLCYSLYVYFLYVYHNKEWSHISQSQKSKGEITSKNHFH